MCRRCWLSLCALCLAIFYPGNASSVNSSDCSMVDMASHILLQSNIITELNQQTTESTLFQYHDVESTMIQCYVSSGKFCSRTRKQEGNNCQD